MSDKKGRRNNKLRKLKFETVRVIDSSKDL